MFRVRLVRLFLFQFLLLLLLHERLSHKQRNKKLDKSASFCNNNKTGNKMMGPYGLITHPPKHKYTHTPNTNTLHYRIFFSFPSFLFAPFFFQISPLWLALIWSDLYISLNTFLFLFSPPPLSISIQFHLYGHGRRHVITLANRLHSLVSVFFFFSLLLRSPHSPHLMNSFFFFLSRWLPWPWSYTTTTTFSLFTYFFIFLPFL